jgi:hypothetical protein
VAAGVKTLTGSIPCQDPKCETSRSQTIMDNLLGDFFLRGFQVFRKLAIVFVIPIHGLDSDCGRISPARLGFSICLGLSAIFFTRFFFAAVFEKGNSIMASSSYVSISNICHV